MSSQSTSLATISEQSFYNQFQQAQPITTSNVLWDVLRQNDSLCKSLDKTTIENLLSLLQSPSHNLRYDGERLLHLYYIVRVFINYVENGKTNHLLCAAPLERNENLVPKIVERTYTPGFCRCSKETGYTFYHIDYEEIPGQNRDSEFVLQFLRDSEQIEVSKYAPVSRTNEKFTRLSLKDYPITSFQKTRYLEIRVSNPEDVVVRLARNFTPVIKSNQTKFVK